MSGLPPRPFYRHLVVATDGSRLSGAALEGGALLASQTMAELHVFHAATSASVEQSVLAQVAELLGNRPHKMVVRDGEMGSTTAEMIAQFARELGDEAIVVVGTHGRGGVGLSLLGSTAVDLLARVNQPTVAYGPESGIPREVERVVACVDGSEFSELSVAEASRWARALSVPLWLVQVVPPYRPRYVGVLETNYVHNLAMGLDRLGQKVEWEVLHSTTPSRSILDMYGSDPATMLLMVTHGRTGLQRVLSGSVSTEVVKGAWGPVVLICPSQ
ncbi:MAG TPA: universal stress protein [Acidimicrobiia bacterium]|nr:universal stress protein [Acidimicrobiia bacterium]